ncbi:hypothetical protein LZ30DRAFT_689947 [Colletotrichum cereale]|nr:hypothetical protein LZ30DRAFT_689947 [Colletotrichum cereale]
MTVQYQCLSDLLLDAFNNQTSNLTKQVKVVDNKGKDTGKKAPRFILQFRGYLSLRLRRNGYSKVRGKLLGHTSPRQAQEPYQHGLRHLPVQGMLDILTSDKYANEGSENSEEFKGAAQGAADILLDLSKNAKEKAEKIEGLVKEITSRYEAELKKETSKNLEVKSPENVIAEVEVLGNQNVAISDKIKEALNALHQIQKLFEQVALDLGKAPSTMGAADGFVRKGLWLLKKNDPDARHQRR